MMVTLMHSRRNVVVDFFWHLPSRDDCDVAVCNVWLMPTFCVDDGGGMLLGVCGFVVVAVAFRPMPSR